MSWNDLSMADRAKYIKLGVSNGITNLSNIREVYNSYAEGGQVHKYDGESEPTQQMNPVLTNLKNYLEGIAATYKQHLLNKEITDEQVVDNYMNNVMYTMENPSRKGFNGERWLSYKDKDSKGITHYNYGPGIESHSDVGATLDYKSKTGYTTEELNSRIRPDLIDKMSEIRKDLKEMYGEDADTMSMGNRLILLDIAHNVRPKGNKRKNMPKS